MNIEARAKKMIRMLEEKGFYAECPCCSEPVLLRKCGLFYLSDFTAGASRLYEERQREFQEQAVELAARRKSISTTSEVGSKAVNLGFILERLAPSMKGFRFERNDCRSLFDPIDYLIFEGLSARGAVTRILFADIKTGSAKLTSNQKEIKSLVESQRVSLRTYTAEERKQ